MYVGRGWQARRLDGIGIEAQLKDVAGLGLAAGQLGVERLVGEAAVGEVAADEEVGDATHAVVDEGHLVDHVMAIGHRIADTAHPALEGLGVSTLGHLEDGLPVRPVVGQACPFVLHPLVHQQLGELAAPAIGHGDLATLLAMLQSEVVRAVQPRRHLGGRQQALR